MHDEDLHIAPGAHDGFPEPGLPADLAWEKMSIMLDMDDSSGPSTYPKTVSTYQKYLRLGFISLFFIFGILCVLYLGTADKPVLSECKAGSGYEKIKTYNNKDVTVPLHPAHPYDPTGFGTGPKKNTPAPVLINDSMVALNNNHLRSARDGRLSGKKPSDTTMDMKKDPFFFKSFGDNSHSDLKNSTTVVDYPKIANKKRQSAQNNDGQIKTTNIGLKIVIAQVKKTADKTTGPNISTGKSTWDTVPGSQSLSGNGQSEIHVRPKSMDTLLGIKKAGGMEGNHRLPGQETVAQKVGGRAYPGIEDLKIDSVFLSDSLGAMLRKKITFPTNMPDRPKTIEKLTINDKKTPQPKTQKNLGLGKGLQWDMVVPTGNTKEYLIGNGGKSQPYIFAIPGIWFSKALNKGKLMVVVRPFQQNPVGNKLLSTQTRARSANDTNVVTINTYLAKTFGMSVGLQYNHNLTKRFSFGGGVFYNSQTRALQKDVTISPASSQTEGDPYIVKRSSAGWNRLHNDFFDGKLELTYQKEKFDIGIDMQAPITNLSSLPGVTIRPVTFSLFFRKKL